MDHDEVVRSLLQIVRCYDAAADKFIQKCRDGRARSVETVAELEHARALSDELTRQLGGPGRMESHA